MPTIEDLLKHPKFRSEGQKSILTILYISNLLNNHFDDILKKFNLTVQQYNVLRILRGQQPNPCTINLIRERMLDKMSDASRIVERLRKAGLVERITSERDRRAVDVQITAKGIEILQHIDRLEKQMDMPVEKLTDEESRQLNHLLQKILDQMVNN